MCGTCGCDEKPTVSVDLHDRILSDNDRRADHNREHFNEASVLALNLMGSPGSGKTALLEATARALGDPRRLRAVSGDLATDRDAARLRAAGIQAEAITTGSACHLDAAMLHEALHDLPIAGADYLFIENVGNLVCPAIFDLGQHFNVVAMSVTEGEDKPLKYPVMFKNADLVVLTKTDLLPALPDVSIAAIEDALARVMPVPRLIQLSARNGSGVAEWLSAIADFREQVFSQARARLRRASP
jgi:hydrogenase nickel incorporation protein HypB